MSASASRPASVYLLYNIDDELLYVGMTVAGMGRLNGHCYDKPWWTEVHHAKFRHCANRRHASLVEVGSIRRLKPKYNILHQKKDCKVCEWMPAVRKGRCEACAAYIERTGRERPEELIVKHARRVHERQAEQRVHGFLPPMRHIET